MIGPVSVLAGERDARTIYDIACIREEKQDTSREDVEFKAIALRNYQFCAAVAELIEAAINVHAAVRAGKEPDLIALADCIDAVGGKSARKAALANVGSAK